MTPHPPSTPEARRIMSGATTDEEYHLWLEALAATCNAAPGERPCEGCQQGGVCDGWSETAKEMNRMHDDSLERFMTGPIGKLVPPGPGWTDEESRAAAGLIRQGLTGG